MLIIIRITFDKVKRSYTKYASGILIIIRITFDKEKRSYAKYALEGQAVMSLCILDTYRYIINLSIPYSIIKRT